LSDRLVYLSLQGIVLVVKAIQPVFYGPRYTEVVKFYKEPDIIG
jgi:hypothetical protein